MQHINIKKLISKWDSERELFNDDIIHALQNTIDSGIHSATGRRYSSQPEAKH